MCAVVDGTCYGLATGPLDIEVKVEACGGYSTSDYQVGYQANRQLTVMEIYPQMARGEPD